jgi:hypothetical protein
MPTSGLRLSAFPFATNFSPDLSAGTSCRGHLLDGVAAANHAGMNHATQNSPLAPQFFLQTSADFVHARTRVARRSDFQNGFADPEAVALAQGPMIEAPSRDILLYVAREDTQLLQRLSFHQQDLPLAPATTVDATLEAFVEDGLRLIDLANREAVHQGGKEMFNPSHARHLGRRVPFPS